MRAWRLRASIGLVIYFTYVSSLIGMRGEHVLAAALFVGPFFFGKKGVRTGLLFLPVFISMVAFDSVRLFIHLRAGIHVSDIYDFEQLLFGVGTGEARQILPLYFLRNNHPFLDGLCGAAYIAYVLVPAVVAIVWYFQGRTRRVQIFSLAFMVVNLTGILTYLVFPVAPPWYVEQHGLGPAVLDALPSAAGAARFDMLFGVNFFREFYSRNPNVFGAMPSLHCAYPALLAFVCRDLGAKWWLPAALFTLLVAFSAVYLTHHYVLDALAGVIYAWGSSVLISVCFRIPTFGKSAQKAV